METKVRKEEKKKLLIYAHYYAPDVASTGQILKELAEGMLDVFDITVICVVPSYGGKINPEYRRNRFYYEEIDGVHVIRVRVPEFDKTNKLSRIRNIAAYAVRAALATFQVKNVDYVFSISQPPILGGLLGVWGKLTRQARFIYNIQDFNPEQVIAVNYTRNPLILKTAMALDKFSCRRADKVIVVGRDMVDTLKRRFQQNKLPRYAFINNWVDEKELYPLPADDPQVAAFRRKYGLENKYVIMYSGNLGLYYDLENLIRVIKEFRKGRTMDGRIEDGPLTADGREVVFAFVGAGSMKRRLEKYKEKHHIDNVIFIPYQKKEELIYSLNAADVHWCVSAKGIKGVSVPSKLYGCLAVQKPVIGVMEPGAEARLIMEEIGCGYVCDPGDYEHVARHVRWFIEHAGSEEVMEMGRRGREYLVKNLTRDVSVEKYVDEILGC